jgi:diazepam-binding inhibitor (GABA receptor modulator, acyl-CoA-binding protein)
MPLEQDFAEAQERVKRLSRRPGNQELLQLYALYKQATDGDVTGKRPGMLDLVGRAKYDAWASRRGTDPTAAMREYVTLVEKLAREIGLAGGAAG